MSDNLYGFKDLLLGFSGFIIRDTLSCENGKIQSFKFCFKHSDIAIHYNSLNFSFVARTAGPIGGHLRFSCFNKGQFR